MVLRRRYRRPAWKCRLKSFRKKNPFKNLTKTQLLKYVTLGSFVGLIVLFLFSTLLFAWYSKDLPQPDKIVRKEGFSTKIYDREGILLYDVFADQQRTPVEWDKIPQYLKDATVAIEDKNFYEHKGFDPRGWIRAGFNIVFKGRIEGGSTLTQQLVKNVLLSPKRVISRKIKEFALAIQIEKKYTKDEILKMYLNEAPYGGTAWGVGTASETYFAKEVQELNLIESAILAGLPQRPSFFSPFGPNPKAYESRTKDVLRRMREDDYITKDQEKQALEDLEKIKFNPTEEQFKAPHFVMYIKSLLEERYGEAVIEQGGLKVHTTLDWELQKEAQEIVSEEIEKVEVLNITNGAAMVMDPNTGEILAMVGSKNYFDKDYDGQVNVCLSLRQPGSAIKPITYLAALKRGYTPASLLIDVITHFPGGAGRADYIPKNYDGKTHGPVQLRYALGNSLNIPSVKLLAMTGLKNMLQTAFDLGLTTLEPTDANIGRFGLTVTLGGGEVRLLDLISSYSSFANKGRKVSPVAILKIEDTQGKTLEEYKDTKGKQVISEEEAFLISDILSDNQARILTFGANSLLNISGRSVAVKTGTTDDMRDNWAIGWTPGKIVAIWVGNNDNSQMKQVASGISGASPIWRRIILEVLKKEPIQEFSLPSGIVSKEVDVISGYSSHDGWASRKEFFIKGTEPTGTDPIHTKLKICRSDQGKLAPDTLVAKGEYEEKEFIVLKEDDPLNTDKNRWQEGIDAWLEQQSDEKYKFPRDYCEVTDEVIINIRKPGDKSKVSSNFEVDLEITSNYKIKEVKIYLDDELKKTLTEKPFNTSLSASDGIHKLKVKAKDEKANEGEKTIEIGVNQDPKASPSPSPTPTPSPEVSPSPSAEP
ncbi:penicillin-binding protein [Candidatus Beckwithbacteria bacterium CG10_big_fil_rev_8_21_14_0_10_34_10]|uniref:Penicillin-binding protein n=1 Tax=Candidatus Beckwithbacteria bacterium CG10_big_fil_rev_8_21_14_0_10_34_10 TaxID=1974495 RepID=A0A2H0WAS9_9BACT|nr:MAG: penicillin-binding protein [Candidatus Beckwithbacteria bacterium CG10_big_fil_rev_8_21_14_0_10_34_10]